jgi:serpin B
VALPYADAKLQMLVVFPKQDDGLAALEQQLDGQRVQDVAQALRSTNVALEFPKFKVEGQTESLKPVLEKLGMKSIFVSSGDLSGISTSTKLTVRDVMHKAFVEVDEKGTEAAAATAILAESTSAPAAPPRAVKVNRPFAFFLQDVPTQAVIFAGHVTNP